VRTAGIDREKSSEQSEFETNELDTEESEIAMNQGLNRVTLFGHLGADPELRKLPSGTSLLRMRLATNYSFLTKEGAREDRTDWHTVIMWGARGEGLARILSKGQALIVEGQIRTHSYEKEGEKRYATDIHADNVILTGRRPDADTRRDGDEHETLPFGPSAADLRDDDDDSHERSGGRRAPDDFEPVSHGDGARPPRSDGGASASEPPPPPPPPRKKTRSPSSAPAMAMA
jgi:single-strand DNA-binding protein